MEESLHQLNRKLKRGDEDAYVYLFDKFYVPLCIYSRRYVGRKDVAEEVVSETMFKVWKNRKKLDIHTSIKAYLFQAVANNSLNALRKLGREENLEQYFSDVSGENIGFKCISDALPDKALLIDELTKRIQDAIDQLPRQQRRVFVLKRYEGKKNKEIAKELGISLKTVEMHLSKAMIRMRDLLKDYRYLILLLMSPY